MFADDTTLFISCSDIMKLYEQTYNTYTNGLNLKKLSLNNSKTFYIIFSNNKKVVEKNLQLVIANKAIPKKMWTNFLGMYSELNKQFNLHDKQNKLLYSH